MLNEARMNNLWSTYPEINDELKLVEEKIKSSINSRNKLVSEIANDIVMAGGKRLRPALVIICSKFGKYDRQKVLSMAGALEILHTATLIHDDIIDCSKLRRGKVTVSEKYGTDMAVYIGDFLFTKAILTLSNGISIDKLDRVAGAIKTICEGEVDQYQDRYNAETSVAEYLKRINRKTAILFGAAAGMGAHISECSERVSRNLARFGIFYGMAFQIRDDLNDFLADENSSGKPVEKDLTEGLITLPVIYAMKNNKVIRKIIEDLFQKRDFLSSGQVSEICRLVKDSGGVEEARKLQEKYIKKGTRVLGSLPDNEYRIILSKLINSLKI